MKTAIVIIINLICVSLSWSADLIVRPDGETPIHHAIQHAKPGDTLILKPGVYRESPIIVDKSLTIIGTTDAILDGEAEHEIMTVTADNVTIRNLTFQHVGVSFIDDNAGLKLDGVSGCVIEHNRFENTFFGIYLAKAESCRIAGNTLQSDAIREVNSGNGIHLWYCKNIDIEDNHISGHRDGIYFEFVEETTISDNASEGNLRYGLHFMFSHNCTYADNVFRDNGAGVAVMFTKEVEMSRNRFERNWGPASYGILLKEITDSRIYGNVFVENTIGLYAEGCNRLTIDGNDFERNGWAIKMMSSSMDNAVTGNNFLANTFDVSTNSRQNFNTFEGNYWSGYTGYDLNKDGVGDVPFRPVRLFSLVVEKQPPALILLRSVFIDLLDVAERMIPMLTPETLIDEHPRMEPIHD